MRIPSEGGGASIGIEPGRESASGLPSPWWVHLDSNQGPAGYEPVALTAELWTLSRQARGSGSIAPASCASGAARGPVAVTCIIARSTSVEPVSNAGRSDDQSRVLDRQRPPRRSPRRRAVRAFVRSRRHRGRRRRRAPPNGPRSSASERRSTACAPSSPRRGSRMRPRRRSSRRGWARAPTASSSDWSPSSTSTRARGRVRRGEVRPRARRGDPHEELRRPPARPRVHRPRRRLRQGDRHPGQRPHHRSRQPGARRGAGRGRAAAVHGRGAVRRGSRRG